MNTLRSLTYGLTSASDRSAITLQENTWAHITDLFRVPARRKITWAQYQAMSIKGRAHSKNTGLFFGGSCADGHRSGSTLTSRSIVNLDLDDDCQAVWDEYLATGSLQGLSGLSYLLHTTRSHSLETPKMRILIPLSRDISPAEYEPVARALAEYLDASMMAVARESYTPAQGMYLPSVSADQEFWCSDIDGAFFDPDTALDRYPATDAKSWPRRPREIPTAYVAGRKMTHPEDKKALAPIIAAVHRAFDPWTFIEEFLDEHYIASGDRYSYVGASGAPSVRVYDDAFIQSDHGSDPAVGQHNTFDLGRIHLFGELDLDYDTSSLSPVDWPSYKAMAASMLEHASVREAMADIAAEVSSERNAGLLGILDDLSPEDDDAEADDDEEDLIGAAPAPKPATIEEVLRRVRASIGKAPTLDALIRLVETIRAFPIADFRDLHRDLVATDVQRRFAELDGQKITKTAARKMLAPTVENLRDQVAGKALPAWADGWVYVTSTNSFLNLNTKEVLSKDGFNGRYNKEAGDQFGSSDMGLTKLNAFDAATQVFCIPMPYGTRFHPGKLGLFTDEGVTYANTYRPVMVESGGYKGKKGTKLLRRLLADMFPDSEHQGMVLDFFAHCILHPEKKLKYALLIKGSENEGKSLLANLMRKLLGRRNFAIVGPDQLKEKFNGWSYEKLFCVVEEIKIGGREAHDVLNKIKTIITNEEIPIRRMQKDATTESNFCNMYLTTNYEDCLPLEEDNSRYLVLFTRFRTNQEVKDWRAARIEVEGSDYVRELWDHIEDHPLQFMEFFQSYEFSKHYATVGGRAPDTRFKRTMAEDCRSEERLLLEQMLEDGTDPSISSEMLIWPSFRTELDRRGWGASLRGRGVSSFLKPMGFVKARETSVSIDGEKHRLVAWTRDTQLLVDGDRLSSKGAELAREAIRRHNDLDDLESLADNVIRLRR